MYSIRCRCGKIVCQVANLPEVPRIEESEQLTQGPAAVILCRHCKRYVVLRVPRVSAIQFTSDANQLHEEPLATVRS